MTRPSIDRLVLLNRLGVVTVQQHTTDRCQPEVRILALGVVKCSATPSALTITDEHASGYRLRYSDRLFMYYRSVWSYTSLSVSLAASRITLTGLSDMLVRCVLSPLPS